MRDNLRMLAYMAKHDPAVIIGLALIATAAFLLFRIQMQLVRAGHRFMLLRGLDASLEYVKLRKQYGWSLGPFYGFWLFLALGVGSLVFGVFHL